MFHFFVSNTFLSENNVKILVSAKFSDSIRSLKTFKTPHGIIRQFTKAIFIVSGVVCKGYQLGFLPFGPDRLGVREVVVLDSLG